MPTTQSPKAAKLGKLYTKRVELKTIKETKPRKLGKEEPLNRPVSDLEAIYLARAGLDMLNAKIRLANRKSGVIRSYEVEESDPILGYIDEYCEAFNDELERTKKRIEKTLANHELVRRITAIKGISTWQLILIMSELVDPTRFATFGKLSVYSGVGEIYGMKICKANIAAINKRKLLEWTGDEGDYRPFGYNTRLQGRLYAIAEILLKQKGWFYDYYSRTKLRLIEKAINEGRTFMATAAQVAESEGKMEVGNLYIVGKRNQSVKMFAHKGAIWRMMRILLHIIWVEWMDIRQAPVRPLYSVEYLGHQRVITLADVLAWEKGSKGDE